MVQGYLSPTRSVIRKTKDVVFGIVLTLILFSSLMVFNVIQVSSLVVLPFSRKAFRAINRWCANSWWGLCVLGSEHLLKVRPVFTGDAIPPGENAIVFANHQQMPDILAVMMFSRRKDRLGDLKFFVKEPLKYVPGLGWGMQFLDCLFVSRNWETDAGMIDRTFSRFLREGIPLWLVTFAEGTRITRSKLSRAQEYARKHGHPVLENVLLPRTKGFVAAVGALRPHIRAVYDVTIGYPDGIPSLWLYVQGWVRRIHVHIRRFPIETLPKDDALLAAWLMGRFEEKDRMLAAFHEEHDFSALNLSPA